MEPTYDIPELPPTEFVESTAVLKAAAKAHRYLAELKGRAASIPNQGILLDTLSLQEAKASSEIENIVTTQDELFQVEATREVFGSAEAKEVARYNAALKQGYQRLLETGGLITNNALIEIYQILKETTAEFRTLPGTVLKNDHDDVIYVPPQESTKILLFMRKLEAFINDSKECDLDPLVKMAIVHHQFESIHPFSDGNGRIGRILNVLYLTQQDLLEIPILYLSRYITQNKAGYYQLLQSTRDTGEWEPWVLYMLDAIYQTSKQTLFLVDQIKALMATYKKHMRTEHQKIYSQDLLNNLFKHPYTRIEYVVDELGVGRQTAGRYLDQLAESGLIEKVTKGVNNYYINIPLVELLTNGYDD